MPPLHGRPELLLPLSLFPGPETKQRVLTVPVHRPPLTVLDPRGSSPRPSSVPKVISGSQFRVGGVSKESRVGTRHKSRRWVAGPGEGSTSPYPVSGRWTRTGGASRPGPRPGTPSAGRAGATSGRRPGYAVTSLVCVLSPHRHGTSGVRGPGWVGCLTHVDPHRVSYSLPQSKPRPSLTRRDIGRRPRVNLSLYGYSRVGTHRGLHVR